MAVQAVGDALSGVLMVEAGLRRRQWGLGQWAELYQDLPSRQTKVLVADRSVISTINAETQVASPPGLQALIDQAVAGWQCCLPSLPYVLTCSALHSLAEILSLVFTQATSFELFQTTASTHSMVFLGDRNMSTSSVKGIVITCSIMRQLP